MKAKLLILLAGMVCAWSASANEMQNPCPYNPNLPGCSGGGGSTQAPITPNYGLALAFSPSSGDAFASRRVNKRAAVDGAMTACREKYSDCELIKSQTNGSLTAVMGNVGGRYQLFTQMPFWKGLRKYQHNMALVAMEKCQKEATDCKVIYNEWY